MLHLQIDCTTIRILKCFFTLIYFGGSYEKLVYGWQRSPGLRASAIPMRFVSFVSLVSLVSLVSVVSLLYLVHKKGKCSGGASSRNGFLIIQSREGDEVFPDKPGNLDFAE